MSSVGCPACQERRQHTEADWRHHPLRGHGYTQETGWTYERVVGEGGGDADKATTDTFNRWRDVVPESIR